jgi:hypothetical protein
LLLSGCVKITQIGWNGNEVILRLDGSGEIIGAFGLLTSATRTYCSTAQTTQSSTALVWDAANSESILGRFRIKLAYRIPFVEKCLRGELAAFGVHHPYGLLSRVQIAAYNFHLGLLRPEPFLVGYRKVYSGRCEADVVMTPVTG